jgi:hypothetical protein
LRAAGRGRPERLRPWCRHAARVATTPGSDAAAGSVPRIAAAPASVADARLQCAARAADSGAVGLRRARPEWVATQETTLAEFCSSPGDWAAPAGMNGNDASTAFRQLVFGQLAVSRCDVDRRDRACRGDRDPSRAGVAAGSSRRAPDALRRGPLLRPEAQGAAPAEPRSSARSRRCKRVRSAAREVDRAAIRAR